jgi:hypothetical protein
MFTTWYTHMIGLGFITPILFAKLYLSWSSSLCSFLWSHYILHTKVNAAAREDHNLQILYTVPIAAMQATGPAYFLYLVVIISAAECALCGSSLCSCQSYLQSWVQILCPLASHWPISQIVVKLRNRDFVLSFSHLMLLCAGRKKCISCWNVLSCKIHCSH